MAHRAPTNRLIAAVPNGLTILRLGLAAVFPAVDGARRLGVVILAAFSDWLDGFVARRFGVMSASGMLLDAIADKLFVFSVVLTLTVTGPLAWWQMLLVIVRDLTVAYVALHVALRRDWASFGRLVPRIAGRITTGCQFALFIAIIVWEGSTFTTVVFGLTSAASVIAAVDYLIYFSRALLADRRTR